MAKSLKQVTVNFVANPMTCNPDPVPVSKANNKGIRWKANQKSYTFTGVKIGNNEAPTGVFGTPVITTVGNGASKRSQMDVSDAGDATPTDYEYTLLYTDPDGNALTLDPTIENRN